MCHIPASLSIEELEYVALFLEIDPSLTTLELLSIIQERREYEHKRETDDSIDDGVI